MTAPSPPQCGVDDVCEPIQEPCCEEIRRSQVDGDHGVQQDELPADLDGLYVRNGPNRQFAADGRYHWFDGDGMLHGVRFERGRAQYRNAWIGTDGLNAERAAGSAQWRGIKEAPRAGMASVNDGAYKNTANTDVKFWNGQLLAMWYLGGSPYRVAVDSLATTQRFDVHHEGRRIPISAHSKVDEITGELIFFAYDKVPPYMQYGVVSADGERTHCVAIDLPGPRLPHDMAITKNYSILHDLPLFYDKEAFKLGRHKLKFYNDVPSRFGVIPRHGRADQIRWFEAKSTFLYHVANAWEETSAAGDEIVMIGTPYRPPVDSPDPLAAGQRIARMVATLENDCVVAEWRFNLTTGQTCERIITDEWNVEFPSANPQYQGRASRYAWNILMEPSLQPEQPRFAGIVKVDTQSGKSQCWRGSSGDWFSETPFCPKANASAEDDGYLTGFVWNAAAERSECHVFDARDIAQGPIAKLALPQRVPHGFHSVWVPEERLPT